MYHCASWQKFIGISEDSTAPFLGSKNEMEHKQGFYMLNTESSRNKLEGVDGIQRTQDFF
jgi:hypothetical protein